MPVLVLEEVSATDQGEIARLEEGDLIVGREPDQGVSLRSQAVSRNHGQFTKFRSHCLYKDLGSTNGSWVNSVQLVAERWRVVRSGDVLQLADMLIRLKVVGSAGSSGGVVPNIGGRSLIVMFEGRFTDEFPVAEYGRALVIGGSKPDLELVGDLAELPSLVIERRGSSLCAFRMAKEMPVLLNGAELTELVNIRDGDLLAVGNYQIVINDPGTSGHAIIPPRPAGQEHSDKVPVGKRFGRELTAEETVAIDTREMEAHRAASLADGDSPQAAFEDRLVVVLGLVLLLALVALVTWWMLA